ncbi:MAG TPA: hypothetical protein PLN19_08910 [Methanothrix sp.]|nr:hypothetical protein [Methanothrix sp.]
MNTLPARATGRTAAARMPGTAQPDRNQGAPGAPVNHSFIQDNWGDVRHSLNDFT